MKKELTDKSEIKLVGLTVRTNNKNEMNPQTSKIGELARVAWMKYAFYISSGVFHSQIMYLQHF